MEKENLAVWGHQTLMSIEAQDVIIKVKLKFLSKRLGYM